MTLKIDLMIQKKGARLTSADDRYSRLWLVPWSWMGGCLTRGCNAMRRHALCVRARVTVRASRESACGCLPCVRRRRRGMGMQGGEEDQEEEYQEEEEEEEEEEEGEGEEFLTTNTRGLLGEGLARSWICWR